jgi:hypothetical protein
MVARLSLVDNTMLDTDTYRIDGTIRLFYPALSFEDLFEEMVDCQKRFSSFSDNTAGYCLMMEKFEDRGSLEQEVQSIIDFISRSQNVLVDNAKRRVFTYMEKDFHMFLSRLGFELLAIYNRGGLEKAQVLIDVNKYGIKYTVSINSHRVVDCIDQDCPDFYTNSLFVPF